VLTVGLTGGIASGKSAVANMFVKLGAGLVDTDVLAREVVAPGEPGLAAVRKLFGPSVITAAGELNRAVMRSLIFADADKRRHLEDLLHPLIRERTLRRLEQVEGPYAIVVVPLLVETGFVELVDRVLVVDCPPALQLERLINRDRIPRAQAVAMIEAQADRVSRLQAADDVIDNSGDLESTRRQVHHLHDHYVELARANRS
jgi:dephospho-CoA kinase